MDNHKAVDITYNKPIGGSGELQRFEHSDRTIIPTRIPTNNIKALDVTGLNEDEVKELEVRVAEYAQYREAILAASFSFEDWSEITYGPATNGNIKWRTFDKDGIFAR